MAQHMLSAPDVNFTDPRRNNPSPDSDSQSVGEVIFTANATGTTTTLVGATQADGVNAVRVGDKGVIFNASGVQRDNYRVVTVTGVDTDTSDTITFSPALEAATATGFTLRSVNPEAYVDNTSLDARLVAAGGCYTQAYVDGMTQNDKVYAVRLLDDPTSFLG